MSTKVCKTCKEDKLISSFPIRKVKSKEYVRTECTPCYKLRRKRDSKKYRDKNPEAIKIRKAKYYLDNIDREKAKRKSYRESNKDKIKLSQKLWYEKNKEHKREYERSYHKSRVLNDIQYRLSKLLRSRLWLALKTGQKSGSAVEDLGCSIEEFKSYLESKFKEGMSWDNQGNDWHIDHIRPLASFDLSDREQLKQATHYTNLQPLWAEENLRKGAKYEEDCN